MRSFEEIGKSTETDKVRHHGYHRFYPIFLEKYRKTKIKMLEIGTYENKSLRLWQEYFPLSKIYGLDKITGFKFKNGEVFMGDQSDINFLKTVIQKIGTGVEFILDDGSHKPEHQIKSFNYLFINLLKSGGVYIIEDIETSYWRKGVCNGYLIQKGYKHKGSVVEIFKNLIDKLNEEFLRDKSVTKNIFIPKSVQDKIGLISFQYNSIIILKKDKTYKQYEHRKYRYADAL